VLCTQWGRDGDDTVSSLVLDARQRVYVGGKTDGALYGPAGFVSGTPTAGFGDAIVASYEADGGFRWGVQWGGADRDGVFGLKLDPTGQSLYAVAGRGSRAEVRQLIAADGGTIWRQEWSPANAASIVGGPPRYLEVAPNGRVVMAGTATAGFHGQIFNGGSDVYVSSWTPDGGSVWTRFVGTVGTETVGGMAVDSASNVYVCGTVGSSLDNQPYGGGICGAYDSCGQPTSNGGYPCSDAVLVKFSPTGQKLWTRQWGIDEDERCSGLQVNSQGVLLALGTSGPAGAPTLTRFDVNGNLLSSRRDLLYVTGAFFLDGQDNPFFGSPGDLVKFDPTGTTLLSQRQFLTPGQFVGVADFVFGQGGSLYVAGSGSNYCRAPSPPGTQNNGFWALYGP
jgi:hypothetical protein